MKPYQAVFIRPKHWTNTKYWDQGRLPLSRSKDVEQTCEYFAKNAQNTKAYNKFKNYHYTFTKNSEQQEDWLI